MNDQKQILIIDDDLTLLEVVHARLTSAGFKVYKAANGKTALTLIEKHTIDLLISDIKMPEMSGMELLDKVRSIYPYLPVIFLTAYSNEIIHLVSQITSMRHSLKQSQPLK